MRKFVLLSDFDETIVNIDTGEFALERFGEPDWRQIEKQYERGEITFEESLRKEFGSIKVPENVILKELQKVVEIRPHFEGLVDCCKRRRAPLIVVSGGLDFCIRHFLNREGWLSLIEICAPKAEYSSEGYRLTFPKLLDRSSVNFKDDLVRYHRKKGAEVFYIGDGLGDYPAAKKANIPFAIKGSRLAQACREGNLPHREIIDFQEVIEAIESHAG